MLFESCISCMLWGRCSQVASGSNHHQNSREQFAVKLPEKTLFYVQFGSDSLIAAGPVSPQAIMNPPARRNLEFRWPDHGWYARTSQGAAACQSCDTGYSFSWISRHQSRLTPSASLICLEIFLFFGAAFLRPSSLFFWSVDLSHYGLFPMYTDYRYFILLKLLCQGVFWNFSGVFLHTASQTRMRKKRTMPFHTTGAESIWSP